MKLLLNLCLCFCGFNVLAQTNIIVTNTEADAILKGDFTPANYASSNPIMDKTALVAGINDNVSPDSMKTYIIEMSQFHTRNTGSDTLSSYNGIGAARIWAYNRLQQFRAQNENRLIVSYLQFDQTRPARHN